jgi:Tol biopolymer transport system component
MRTLALGLVLAAAVGLLGVGLAGREPDRSACGDVGDRERAISPGRGRSAFVRCTPEGSAWLYVEERGRERRLVPARFNCCYRPSESVVFRDPAWSPDGRRLAVVVEDVGGTDVWVIDAAGRSARRITSGPERERDPAWSRGGRAVTFRTETGRVLTAPTDGL